MAAGSSSDAMLQKVTAALAAGSYPDIAYVFGSDLASIARSPRVVDLTDAMRGGPTPWNSFWAPVREAVTVNGQVRAAPALLDSLAVVCNRKLFAAGRRAASRRRAGPGTEFTDTARTLTDAGARRLRHRLARLGRRGHRLAAVADDLGPGRGRRRRRRPEHRLRRRRASGRSTRCGDSSRDKSVYIDPKPGSEQMYQVFLCGRMAMVATGPWQLPDIMDAEVDYDVVPLPSYSGRPVTISGPDTWTVFDNGSARSRAAASSSSG